MFKKTVKDSQLDVFGEVSSLLCSNAAQEYSDKNNWNNLFREQVILRIDEESYRVLFSEKMGAPNASIRTLIGMMLLKEAFGYSDSQLFEQCRFNLLVRSALGLFNLTDSLPATSTYYLLRKKIYEYEKASGKDLFEKTFSHITREQVKEFEVDGRSIRMDSKLIGSNIAYYSRFEIIHHTFIKFIKSLDQQARFRLSKQDRDMVNEVVGEESGKIVYRSTKEEIKSRMHALGILIYKILKIYSGNESEQFQLLQRVFNEQYKVDHDQQIELRPKEEITSGSVQSPEDPESAYRNKSNDPVKGYTANLTETCSDGELNLITNAKVKKANQPDNGFVQDAIQSSEEVTEQKVLHAHMDGAYHSPANQEFCKDIDLVLTGLQGYQSRYDLEMTAEGLIVTDNNTGITTQATLAKKTKHATQDRWRIPTENGYYYFDEKAINASEIRRKLKNRTPEELHKRNNVEASIFQLSYYLRKGKSKYCGLFKNQLWAWCRCLWINFIRIMKFIKQTCQRTFNSMENLIYSILFSQILSFFRPSKPKYIVRFSFFLFCYCFLSINQL
jgi:hypothetical protein